MEYLRLVKACHDRTSDVDNVSIQLIDEFLNKIENLNIPTSGRSNGGLKFYMKN